MVSKLGRFFVQATVLFVVFGINTANALPYEDARTTIQILWSKIAMPIS